MILYEQIDALHSRERGQEGEFACTDLVLARDTETENKSNGVVGIRRACRLPVYCQSWNYSGA